MLYRVETTPKGSRHLDLEIDERAEKVIFIVTFALYGAKYKKFTYNTLKAANKKFDDLGDFIK